jgi:hypothetical protein
MNSTNEIEEQRANHAPDASVERRPGHPMERSPEPIANAHWIVPDRQTPRDEVLMDPSRQELTPTFGAEQPPRGISGLLRRAAYMHPDYRARRWMLLIFADRVDAVESTALRTLKHPATWVVLAAAGAGWLMLDRRAVRRLFH